MTLLSLTGAVASITSVIFFFPQIYKIYRTRSAKDLSWGMLLNGCVCSGAWVVYGILIASDYVWITNALSLGATGVVIAQKIHYGRQKKS